MPPKIVVVGSLHHDIVVEAPRQPHRGETLLGHRWFTKFGGKGGNQAVACAQLGADVEMVGAIGDDAFGHGLRTLLEAESVGHDHVVTVETGSGMSIATVDDEGDYSAVVVTGANATIMPTAIADMEIWIGCDVLILQNEVPQTVNLAAAQSAKKSGARVVWNAAPMRPDELGLAALIDILVVNAVEAEQFLGQAVKSLNDANKAAQAIAAGGISAVVTAGAFGVAWADRDGASDAHPVEPVEHPQTHGAGDVFTGALSVALGEGAALKESVIAANAAARRHVSGQA